MSEEDWLFPARYIPRRRLLGWQERIPVAELIAARPDVLVQEYDRSHLTAGFIAGTRLAHRTAFRVLPNFDTWSQRTWWREVGKRFVFNAVDAAKVPGADGARLAEQARAHARSHRVRDTVGQRRSLRRRAGSCA